jgi:prepilin-type processing-associated H-X9-DG protein
VIYFGFGSAHVSGCHMAMCDGSVKQVAYNLSADVHRRLANRRDGEVVDEAGF